MTQDQLEIMIGDTGVLLPKGLHHPAHWPKWEGGKTPATPQTQTAPPDTPKVPSADDAALLKRIAAAGPVTAVVRDGKIDAVDNPPDGKPAAVDPADLENIFLAVESLCRNFQDLWKKLKPNLRDLIVDPIAQAQAMAAARERVWYLWDDQILYIETRLSDDADADWKGLDAVARRVTERIRRLEPYLKPAERRPDPPEVEFGDDAPDRINRIAEAVEKLLETAAILTRNAVTFLTDVLQELREGLDRIRQSAIAQKIAETGYSLLRGTIKKLAGFVGTVMCGVTAIVLTNPVAGTTFLSYIHALLDWLLTFFPR